MRNASEILGSVNPSEFPTAIQNLVDKSVAQKIDKSVFGLEVDAISGVGVGHFLTALQSMGGTPNVEIITVVRSIETASPIGRGDNPPRVIITDGEVKVDPPEQHSSIVEQYVRPPRQVTFPKSSYVAWISEKSTVDGQTEYLYHLQTRHTKSDIEATLRVLGVSSINAKYTTWRA